jgi:NitT/TauT family transport system substrate-binding protein
MMKALRFVTALLACAMLAVLLTAPASPQGARKDVNFSLDFLPDGFHAPFYAALENGFYAQEGLNVRISRGYGSGETVRKVAAGQFDIGLAHVVPLIAAKANENAQIQGVMEYMERDMLAVWVRDEGVIKTPKDLEGKNAATSAGNAQYVFFPAFAKAAGFDAGKVNWRVVDAALLGPMLITKQVDAIPLYLLHGPRLIPQAAERGIKLKAFPYPDYGLDTYAEAVFVRSETIKKDPQMVAGFVRASLKGIRWAGDRPEEATKIVVKHNPEVGLEAAKGSWEMTKKNMFTEKALRDGIGRFEAGKLKTTIDAVYNGLGLKRLPTNEEVATNEFVPQQ